MRAREHAPDQTMLRLVTTLIASEVERVRAPERASEEAATGFQQAVLDGRIADRDDLVARGKELGTDLAAGGSVVVVRGHPRNPREDDWRRRLLAVATRGARSIAPGSIGAPTEDDGAEIVLLVPDPDGDTGRRVAAATRRELESGLPGVRVRDRAKPPRRRSAGAAPCAQRGAAGGQRRRGRSRAQRARLRRDRHLPAAAART